MTQWVKALPKNQGKICRFLLTKVQKSIDYDSNWIVNKSYYHYFSETPDATCVSSFTSNHYTQ